MGHYTDRVFGFGRWMTAKRGITKVGFKVGF